MSDTTPPAWAMMAAEEIKVRHLDVTTDDDLKTDIARIIAEHAPKVKSDWVGNEEVKRLKTPFGTYLATPRWWARCVDSMCFDVDSMEEAEAAAQADFKRRVMECIE